MLHSQEKTTATIQTSLGYKIIVLTSSEAVKLPHASTDTHFLLTLDEYLQLNVIVANKNIHLPQDFNCFQRVIYPNQIK